MRDYTLPPVEGDFSRMDKYLRALVTGDNSNLPIPESRVDMFLKYLCENGVSGSSQGNTINQVVKMDVKANEKITLPLDSENIDNKLIIHCYEHLESLETIITIMKQFNNSNAGNFHYNAAHVDFTGGMHIKNMHPVNMTLNGEVYESEVINVGDFIGEFNINVGGSERVINTKRR